mgnify:CR=1 FL=1
MEEEERRAWINGWAILWIAPVMNSLNCFVDQIIDHVVICFSDPIIVGNTTIGVCCVFFPDKKSIVGFLDNPVGCFGAIVWVGDHPGVTWCLFCHFVGLMADLRSLLLIDKLSNFFILLKKRIIYTIEWTLPPPELTNVDLIGGFNQFFS